MYIHIADIIDDNVRMILPPSADGQASAVYTYTVSGVNSSEGITFDGTHIHIADRADDNVRMILPPSADGQAPIVYTYTVSGLSNAQGMTFDGTHIHITDGADDNVRMILPPSADGQASIIYTYTVSGVNNSRGITFDGTHIHIADSSDDNVRMILPPSADGQAPIVYTYTVSGLGNPTGITFDGTHIHIADSSDDNVRMILPPSADGQAPIVYTYTVSGLSNAQGMTFDGPITSQAVLTLTTTDTDIRAGEAVDISIASDIDITGFTASDITVTGGTRGALTGSGMSWTLSVTAGSAGTMTIAIAEDAVSPGNVAASQDFTVNARATATITFDDASGESGGSTGVNIAFGESVTGLQLSELTASAGTLSNLTGSGTSWEADLAFPATGSGTITISLAIDSTSPQNASASATIDYAEADVVVTAGGRLYFISTASDASSTARAYDFDGNRQSADDIPIGAGFWQGGFATDTRIYFVNNGTNTAVAYDYDGNRQTGDDISLDSNSWQAAVASDTRIFVVSDSTNTAVAYDFDGNRQSGDDISLGGGTWAATSRSDNRLYFVNDSVDIARAYDFNGTRQSDDDITLGSGAWRGGLRSDTRIYFVDGTNARAYDYSGTRQSGDDITLGAGRWQGGTAIFYDDDETTDALSFGSETIANQAWTVGTAASITLPEATGGTGAITYSLSPTLPSGKTFTASTRVLAGTPTGRFSSATFTYTAEDADGTTVSLTFTIVVTATAITFASTVANQALVVGTAVNLTLPTASGGVGSLTYSLSTGLPSGITFTAGTRALAGNPTGRFSSATFTYTVTDAEGVTHTLTFTIVVTAPALSFASNIANQSWTVGTSLSLTLPAATGGVGTLAYSLTPGLVNGVTFVTGTRLLSGNPTVVAASATYTYTVTDSESVTHTQTFTIVATASTIVFASTIANQAWMVGTAVNVILPTASGGVGTITYSLTPTLPSGATFVAGTRVLSGTPTGRFASTTFTYQAEDADGTTVEQTFTIVVTAPAITFSPTSFANQNWTVGTAVNLTLPAGSGGVGDLTPSLSPTLPAGVTFTASTRALAGTPTATFSSATFTYTMTDDEGESESITFAIVVTAEALVATTIVEISGDSQTDTVGTALDNPFVVEVRDQNGAGLSGVTVAFAVTGGGGSLSEDSVTTGANGRASSTLTLGSTAGTNTVTADVSGITTTITFTATATAEDLVATSIVRVSGNNQTAVVSTALPNPFVVEVRDQDGNAFEGATVAFEVTGGGGALSTDSVTTGSNGRASSTLTLGSTAGTNTVTATASGITTPVTFTATATATGTTVASHIHLSDFIDDNVRMILVPSSNGQAPIVYTYTVAGLGNPQGVTFDGTHIHIADSSDDNVRMILPPTSNGEAPHRFYLYRCRIRQFFWHGF